MTKLIVCTPGYLVASSTLRRCLCCVLPPRPCPGTPRRLTTLAEGLAAQLIRAIETALNSLPNQSHLYCSYSPTTVPLLYGRPPFLIPVLAAPPPPLSPRAPQAAPSTPQLAPGSTVLAGLAPQSLPSPPARGASHHLGQLPPPFQSPHVQSPPPALRLALLPLPAHPALVSAQWGAIITLSFKRPHW